MLCSLAPRAVGGGGAFGCCCDELWRPVAGALSRRCASPCAAASGGRTSGGHSTELWRAVVEVIVEKAGSTDVPEIDKKCICRSVSQLSKYLCEFCGKFAVRRKAVGIWGCKDCGKVKAGGAYTMNAASAVTVRSTIWRLWEQTEA
ncbi:unnamed protein product [Miscanthus lutarioriparius]|uniref:Uncharacterized protein n=1 Tax=Miscanthus lutarioriparius TaxID=422564 RepID=A0A811RJ60_9POAL|nr:unnamed protein product [Miscanthus lutarioriparius]